MKVLLDKSITKNKLEEYKEHIIYGLAFFEKPVYLITDNFLNPIWISQDVCYVCDNKLSSLWCFKKLKKDNHCNYTWGYKELVNIDNHNNDLMKRKPKAIEIFYKRKKEMDLEFPNFSIKQEALIVDEALIKCPKCSNEWQSTSIFGMVKCPKCKTIMHNPKYKKL